MRTDYLQRLKPVIRYLEQNFNQPLNLPEVAAKANISPYHFHRIFKAVTNETLAEYLRRLRLERIATDLFYKQVSITELALENGFSSSQSLAKAFKQRFGLTPSELRECESNEKLCQLMRNSKIGHTLRNIGNANQSETPYHGDIDQQRRVTMETTTIEAGTLAYIRVTGPYGQGYEEAMKHLCTWAGAKGFSCENAIFIYHDNPEITPDEKCRTDICFRVPADTQASGRVELQVFPGGSYAYIRQTVKQMNEYGQAWSELMKLVVDTGLESDERPCFELYHSFDPQTYVSDVSFCTAVKI
ncbi:DNA gyrase inhibitor [Shewanella sediminis HAW-EB3]|uniref:DNA gyrase inhibitor n=1 Tax=Shewanella sediminis (strain HAW-EB3) TaxID=425104 RepID=A8FZF8_SHESH|nr:AraC family transcriptional regulator [Shewanella sediminis]ABV38231.1 DNA gyrase inhibitor [Shewanella sediminis HAW-EB3]